MTAPTTGVAMPEWLTRRDQTNGAWNVQEGPPLRGEAWTQIDQRVMRVPFGGDETNRVIRAHEMMHARVSPNDVLGTELGVTAQSIIAAEEFRVNTLIKAAGFDLDVLVDGSEAKMGKRLAEMKDHNGLVRAMAGTGGGKACKDLLRGVRSVDPTLAKDLREIEKALIKRWTSVARKNPDRAARSWGSTSLIDDGDMTGYPSGYAYHTIPMARMLDEMIKNLDERAEPDPGENEPDGEPDKAIDPSILKDLMNNEPGEFANLVFGETRVNRKAKGNLGRKRVAMNTGINPRRINRMLTDPQRRVFDRTRRINGGIVVIDMSGSMRLRSDDVERLMDASPGCTIVGYSNPSGNRNQENAWVLARDGKRVDNLPSGGRGNGVDGPIVEWAATQIKRGEPFVWVCDGVVTSYRDHAHTNLEVECARLVRKHGIHMVSRVEHGVESLRLLGKGRQLPTTYIGPVASAARRLRFIR